jgi:hypothetical protein
MKPNTKESGEAKRALVMAALPGTTKQIAERAGLCISTTNYYLYRLPVSRDKRDPSVWRESAKDRP